MADGLVSIVESGEVTQLATGFEFTEGPTWDPGGFYYFVDTRQKRLYKLVPGREPEIVFENTGSSGTTFDLAGRIVLCDSDGRRMIRRYLDGGIEVLADRYEGKRFNRPNDVICRSDGSIYFTDPATNRIPFEERELSFSGVYRISPNGELSLVAVCEFPNGLAFSPDERVLYVANSMAAAYIHELELAEDGSMTGRRIFADMSPRGLHPTSAGVPDGMKVDVEGRVYCGGWRGVWVYTPDGTYLGTISAPETVTNLVFGGPDLRTIFMTAYTSVYSVRVKTPGVAHPRFRRVDAVSQT